MGIFRIFGSKNREFPCPHCQKPIVVLNVQENGDATLRHPKNGCKAPARDILRAYVTFCKPTLKHPPMGDVADKLWEQHLKDKENG